MPEIETYTFPNREILSLLIKAAGVQDGDWQLQVNFGFSAGNFGSNEANMSPGSITIVASLGITKAKPESPKALVMSAKDAIAFSSTASSPPSEQSPSGAPAS